MREAFAVVLDDAANTCIECGLCTRLCDNFRDSDDSIGGRAIELSHLIANGVESMKDIDSTLVYAVNTCNLCGRCTVDCPVDISSAEVMRAARELFVDLNPEALDLFRTLRVDYKTNTFSLLREMQGVDEGPQDYSGVTSVFFPGCSLSSYAPDVALKLYGMLKERNQCDSWCLECCGKLLYEMGALEALESFEQGLVERLAVSGDVKRVITSCPNCYYWLDELFTREDIVARGVNVEVVPLPELLLEEGMAPTFSADKTGVLTPDELPSLTFHDSCSDRYDLRFGNAIRELYGAHPQQESPDSKRLTRCCGSGGMISATDAAVQHMRSIHRVEDFAQSKTDIVMNACMSCTKCFAVVSDEVEGAPRPQHYLEAVTGLDIDWNNYVVLQEKMFDDENLDETIERLRDLTPVFPQKGEVKSGDATDASR